MGGTDGGMGGVGPFGPPINPEAEGVGATSGLRGRHHYAAGPQAEGRRTGVTEYWSTGVLE